MKKRTKFNAAYLLCLIPVVSVFAFIGLILIPDKFIYLKSLPIWVPIGQQNVSGLSVISVIIVIATMLAWGYCGYFAARKKLRLAIATLTANAIPLLSLLLYVVFNIIAMFGKSNLSQTADMFAVGFGLFNITGGFIYSVSESPAIEIIFDLILTLGTFVIGYSIGAVKKNKNK